MAVLYIQWWLKQISLWRQPEIGTWTVDVLWCLGVMSLRSPPPSYFGDLGWNAELCGAQSPHRHGGKRPFFLSDQGWDLSTCPQNCSAVCPVWIILQTDHAVGALWAPLDKRTLVESCHINFFGQKPALTWHVWITESSIPHSDRAICSHGRGPAFQLGRNSEIMLCIFLKNIFHISNPDTLHL